MDKSRIVPNFYMDGQLRVMDIYLQIGVPLVQLTFSYPYTSNEAKEKVLELARLLTPWCGKLTVHVVPFLDHSFNLQIPFRCLQLFQSRPQAGMPGGKEGRVVFVPYTIPGERWTVRLEKVNKNPVPLPPTLPK